MHRVDYYQRGHSKNIHRVKVEDKELDARVKKLWDTGHIVTHVYKYKPQVDPDPKSFAVRIVMGPVLWEGLTWDEAEKLRDEEQEARPEYTILAYNKKHSDAIKASKKK